MRLFSPKNDSHFVSGGFFSLFIQNKKPNGKQIAYDRYQCFNLSISHFFPCSLIQCTISRPLSDSMGRMRHLCFAR